MMSPLFEEGKIPILNDFIRLANEGKDVKVGVALRKEMFVQKAHPLDTEEKRGEIDVYFLIADFTCDVQGEVYKVSKVYIFGTAGESMNTARFHKLIANDRLKRDYQRLKDAKIRVQEEHFL
jgi:uncharacterized protein YecE (DUF72 family)